MRTLLTGFLFSCVLIGNAQEKLNKLQAPTSPAASIIGVQPSTVLAPKSYQALETALYSNFIDGNGLGVIPNDFALEFTPYWTKDHGLTVEEYLYPSSVMDQIIRNFSFSVASTQNFQLGDSSNTNGLGFGARTTIYFANSKDREKVKAYNTALNSNQTISQKIIRVSEKIIEQGKVYNREDFIAYMASPISEAINEHMKGLNTTEKQAVINAIISKTKTIPFDPENAVDFLNQFNHMIDQELKANILFDEYKTYIQQRQGWSVDIAYANLLNFPLNTFELSYVPRQSIWITPTYNFKDNMNFLKVMTVLKYDWYHMDYFKQFFPKSNVFESNLDYGVAVATQFKKFSIQIELVGRSSATEIPAGTDGDGNELYRKKEFNDLQYMGTFNYNLTEQILLSYSLGRRFEPMQNPNNNLVSILSLNFGFGTPTQRDLKLTE
jgi:hypothetical protein